MRWLIVTRLHTREDAITVTFARDEASPYPSPGMLLHASPYPSPKVKLHHTFSSRRTTRIVGGVFGAATFLLHQEVKEGDEEEDTTGRPDL
mmetsp:Transcript_3074/g.6580  ORF Transcript_3074/g.6580 Transcript_3074/m.6580 type:complete len:91 (+) Transcript_3074:303-575(+)